MRRQTWSVLVLLCMAQFMVVLDMTVVNIALSARAVPSVRPAAGTKVAVH